MFVSRPLRGSDGRLHINRAPQAAFQYQKMYEHPQLTYFYEYVFKEINPDRIETTETNQITDAVPDCVDAIDHGEDFFA